MKKESFWQKVLACSNFVALFAWITYSLFLFFSSFVCLFCCLVCIIFFCLLCTWGGWWASCNVILYSGSWPCLARMGLWALLACLLAVQSCSVSVSVRRASGPLLAHSLQHTTVKRTDREKPLCSDYIIWQLLSTWLSTRPCWPTVPPPILGKRSVMSLFIYK